ncbi:translocation/assembly module TamB domain-containing protein [Cerasicoccus arenae]|uniref:Translocation and assembly module TamB C-terminal domain-containing protein n=1 Tax=Cerasicoccus arenae TaxID=424488 RepID=A0A8J3GE53_9BACT|nr:translocation/assembly module TamB domain-containing protein [Cerasicoccus arenae]MBK1857824.1 translocation/assembly module TamB domain-containing protein [Cerasicoccus arenae]GHC11662.1 hypothetical protein GCM10007047_31190 [Cerasicoccus arenae]
MKRKFLKIFGWTLAVAGGLFLIVLATADFWAPSVIRPLLKEQGVAFDEITRVDGHYTLTKVEYAADGTEATVDELTIPTLWRLVAKKWFGSEEETRVVIDMASINITDSEPKAPKPVKSAPTSVPQQIRTILDYWSLATEWIDLVQIKDVHVDLGGEKLELTEIGLLGGEKIFAQGAGLNGQIDFRLDVDRKKEGSFSISLAEFETGVTLITEWAVSETLKLEGVISLKDQENEITFAAIWKPEGIIPASVHAQTDDFMIPTDLAEIPDYNQPEITLKADWDGAKADIILRATAKPQKADLPPLTVAIEAHGDDQIVNVEKFIAEAWSSKIELSQPLRVEINNLADLPDAELTVELNLSDIPEESLGGRLGGGVTVDHRPGEGWPLVTAKFAGNDLRYEEMTLSSLDFQAVLDWPILTVTPLNASTGEGTTLTMEAVADLEAEALTSAAINLEADGQFLEALKSLIGDLGVSFNQLKLTATASGPFDAPTHAGKVSISGLQATKGVMADFAAEWSADWMDFSALALSLRNERSGLELTGQASLGGDIREVLIKTASIDVREQPGLDLKAPFTILLKESGAVSISPMAFTSEAGGLLSLTADVDYPQKGELDFQAKDLSAVWLDLVLDEPLPFGVKLDMAEIKASWNDGPLTAVLQLDAGLYPPDQPEVEILADATLGEDRLNLTAARILQGDFKLLEAQGELPLTITPAGEELWALDASAAVDFHLYAAPDDSPIWNLLESTLEMDFIRPIMDFRVEGDMKAPTGRLDLEFDALESLGEVERKLPSVKKAEFVVELTPKQISLPTGVVFIAGQKLQIKATAPMTRATWRALIDDNEPPDWKTADVGLDFTDVPLVAFADWLPDVLRSDGDISLRATLKPGENLRGSLDIDGVKTRPLAQLGSVNDINADFRLDGKTLHVQQAEARVGGAPLNVTGIVVLDDEWQPRFDLRLQGENVPLARSPGLILRGSPNITLITDTEGVTTLGGVLVLNESFFTMDIASFQQGGGGGAAQGGSPARPPFFSIDEQPLADWRLHLDLEGDRFLRVRIPAFEGVVSADFSLRGALRDPFMFGAAELQRGIVMFPFATLRLDQGSVSISQNEPEIPKLNIVASGRAYGYDLQMRVTGTASDPVVSFTSTPSLEQSDIILMVTSGQIPQHDRSTESRLSGIGMYIGRSFLVDLGLIDPLDETLTVNVGEDVTTSGKDTINIRYKVNDSWNVVGAYDKYDAYYLDFEWTIYED